MSLANPPRVPVTFEAKQLTVEMAAELGVDVQAVCENALHDEVSRRFKEEHRDTFEATIRSIDKHGLPLAKYRIWPFSAAEG